MVELRKIALPQDGLDALVAESVAEGFQFLTTLQAKWLSGTNRFSLPGEALFGVFEGPILLAVGGLNRDPHLDDPTVGRIRRVYVRPSARLSGIASALLDRLLNEACPHFRAVRLRAISPDAAHLYERFGFRVGAWTAATHILTF